MKEMQIIRGAFKLTDFQSLQTTCKAKKQYLLTCKVSRYCILALHDRAIFPIARLGSSRPQACGVKKPSLAIGKMDSARCYTHRGTRAGVGGLGLGVVVTGEGVAEVVGCCRSYRRDRISSRSSVVTI